MQRVCHVFVASMIYFDELQKYLLTTVLPYARSGLSKHERGMKMNALLTMANISDDKTEELLSFVKMVAQLKLYDGEMESDVPAGDDAVESLDNLIQWARDLIEGGTK